jgi:membrane protein DedA with SNARE-associated domain
MPHSLLDLLRNLLIEYGYWAVAAALLLENAGIPVPGETVLLLASFLAYSEQALQFRWLIVVGTIAATIGDNLGFALGHYGGRPIVERYQSFFRIRPEIIQRGERIFARYGPLTVFFARFVFGMRIIAGPLAGALRMPWRKFVFYNFLGAALWVTAISSAGYLFGQHWHRLVHDLKVFDIAVAAIVAIGLVIWWRRSHRHKMEPPTPSSGEPSSKN